MSFYRYLLAYLTDLKPKPHFELWSQFNPTYQLPNAARDIVALWGEGWLIQLSAVGFVCALAHPTIMVPRKAPTECRYDRLKMVRELATDSDYSRIAFRVILNTTDAPYCKCMVNSWVQSGSDIRNSGSLLLDGRSVACNIFDGLHSTGHCAGQSSRNQCRDFFVIGLQTALVSCLICVPRKLKQ